MTMIMIIMIITIENREVYHLVPESILLLTNNWEGEQPLVQSFELIYKIFNGQLTNTFAWFLVKLGITSVH